ncbi:hypothetical protein GGR50DRAFT_682070, partial [Xylaria sp. CBS 124048]
MPIVIVVCCVVLCCVVIQAQREDDNLTSPISWCIMRERGLVRLVRLVRFGSVRFSVACLHTLNFLPHPWTQRWLWFSLSLSLSLSHVCVCLC